MLFRSSSTGLKVPEVGLSINAARVPVGGSGPASSFDLREVNH